MRILCGKALALEGAIELDFRITKRRLRDRARARGLSCLVIVLLLLSLFPVSIWAAPASMTIMTTPDWTLPNSLTEREVRAGGFTIELTLTDNTWATGLGEVPTQLVLVPTLINRFTTDSNNPDVEQLQALLNQPGATVMRDAGGATLTITIPALTSYNITKDQEITFVPPPGLLQDSSNVPAEQFFRITADPQAALSGSLTEGVTQSDIVAGGKQLVITLYNCSWAADVTTDFDQRRLLFGKIWPVGSSIYNTLISKPLPNDIITVNGDALTITLPAVPGYSIAAPVDFTLGSLERGLLGTPTDPLLEPLLTPLTNIVNPQFTIATDNSIVSWKTVPVVTEATTVSTGITLSLALSNNTWAGDLVTNSAKKAVLLNGLTASTNSAAWDEAKTSPGTAFVLGTTKVADDTLTITIPAAAQYSIGEDQVITVAIPSTVLTNNYPLSNTLTFAIKANPSVAISGTLTSGATILDLVSGGKDIAATLYNTTWDSMVTIDQVKRELLIDGLFSHGSWNALLPSIKAGAQFTRNNDKTVTIVLPPLPEIADPSSPITLQPNINTIKGLTAAGGGAFFDNASASPTFSITPVSNQSAVLTGAVLTATESDIVTGGKDLVITLQNDLWAQDIATNSTKRNTLMAGITAETKPAAWQAVLASSTFVRSSDSMLTITLPAAPNYAIDSEEKIKVVIPSGCTANSTGSFTAGSFTLKAVTLDLSGTAVVSPLETKAVIAGGKTIIITLNNGTWASDILTPTKFGNLKNGFSAGTAGAKIKDAITDKNVSVKGSTLTIKLPPIPDFTSNTPEEIKFSLNGAALTQLVNEKLSAAKVLAAAQSVRIGVAATLSGTGLNMTTAEVVNGGKEIIVTLTNGEWDPALLTNSSKLKALINGFAADSDSASWTLVKTALTKADPTKTFALEAPNGLKITLPPVPGYAPTSEQKVTLTIPTTAQLKGTSSVTAAGQLRITLPTAATTAILEELLEDGSFAALINATTFDKVFFKISPKHLKSVVSKETKIGNTKITSLDCYTHTAVAEISVTINGTAYTSSTYTENGDTRVFNIGFAIVAEGDPDPVNTDAYIKVLDSTGSALQGDEVIKLNGNKTYTIAPKKALEGTYSLSKLINEKTLLTDILNCYKLSEIEVFDI